MTIRQVLEKFKVSPESTAYDESDLDLHIPKDFEAIRVGKSKPREFWLFTDFGEVSNKEYRGINGLIPEYTWESSVWSPVIVLKRKQETTRYYLEE
jgi:hypothetical protein